MKPGIPSLKVRVYVLVMTVITLNVEQGSLIRHNAEELYLAGNATSVAHKDGGFVGGLGISHALHNLIRFLIPPRTMCP